MCPRDRVLVSGSLLHEREMPVSYVGHLCTRRHPVHSILHVVHSLQSKGISAQPTAKALFDSVAASPAESRRGWRVAFLKLLTQAVKARSAAACSPG